jgi:hypothetical protein
VRGIQCRIYFLIIHLFLEVMLCAPLVHAAFWKRRRSEPGNHSGMCRCILYLKCFSRWRKSKKLICISVIYLRDIARHSHLLQKDRWENKKRRSLSFVRFSDRFRFTSPSSFSLYSASRATLYYGALSACVLISLNSFVHQQSADNCSNFRRQLASELYPSPIFPAFARPFAIASRASNARIARVAFCENCG